MCWDNSGSIEKFGGCGGRRGVGRSRSRSKGVLKHFVAEERLFLTGGLRPRTRSGIERTGGSGKEIWLEKETGRRLY